MFTISIDNAHFSLVSRYSGACLPVSACAGTGWAEKLFSEKLLDRQKNVPDEEWVVFLDAFKAWAPLVSDAELVRMTAQLKAVLRTPATHSKVGETV